MRIKGHISAYIARQACILLQLRPRKFPTLNIPPDQVMQSGRTVDNRESSWNLCCSFISQRWLFTILATVGVGIQTAFTVIMSITIIEMVTRTDDTESQVQDYGDCRSTVQVVSLTNQTFFAYDVVEQNNASFAVKRYPWDEYTQGLILSSFSWSNVIVQFVCGSIAERFGGKHFFGIGIFVQSLLTVITPFVVDWGGATALIISRVLIGFGTDGMYPVVSHMISHWSLPEERTLIGNTVYSGTVLGLFFGNIIPVLVMKYSGMGWPAVFYAFGLVGIVWFPFWQLFVYETPIVHPFISDKELDRLKSSADVEKSSSNLPPTPWSHILACKEFWAFTINYIGGNWAYYLMLSDLPKYMGNVVKFPLESNGYFSALPFIVMWLNTILSAWINDKILDNKWMSLTNTRKLLSTISTTGPAIFLLLASYAECDKIMVVSMFMIGITLIGGFYTSTLMNPLDLSPNYAGSIMSAGSGIAAVVSILAPYVVGILTPNSSLVEWRVVFWIVFLFSIVSNAVYLILFKADVQPWNDPNFLQSKTEITEGKNAVNMEEVS